MLADTQTQSTGPTAEVPARPGAVSTYIVVPAAIAVLAASLIGARAAGGVAGELGVAGVSVVLAVAVTRRWRVAADHLGVVALAAMASAVTATVLQAADTRQHGVILTLALVALVTGAAGISWVLAEREPGQPLATTARSISQPFTSPVTSWGMGLIGGAMALPLIGTYAPAITDSDSAWLVVSTEHVRAQGIELLERNQDVLLPHLVLSPLLDLGGLRLAIVFTILSTLALAALTAVLAHRVSHSLVGTTVAVATLLSFPEIVARSDRLPMYSAMLFFGYGAGALLHRAMGHPRAPWWIPVAAGTSLMLSVEAHSVGQLFLMLPFLMVILHPWARARKPLLVTLLTMLVVGIPRVVINLSEGGTTAFRSNYTDFMIQKGYLRSVNRDFWGQTVDASPLKYLANVPALARGAFGQMSFGAAVVIGAYAAVRAGGRARVFGIAVTSTYLLALSVASPGTYGRYLLPLSLGAVLVVGVGASRAVAVRGEARLLGGLLAGLLLVGALANVGSYVHRSAERHREVFAGSWPVLASLVDDGTAVLGVRSHELVWTDPTLKAEFSRTMSESDFVTFLTWPSDAAVLDVMRRIDAGWIFVLRDAGLETLYHQTWVGPAYGLPVRHVRQLALSDAFCLVAEIDGRRLYRVGGCPNGYLPGPYEPADVDGDGVPDALEPRLGVDDPPPPFEMPETTPVEPGDPSDGPTESEDVG